MIEYGITASITISTNVKKEGGLLATAKEDIKAFIEDEGVDAFIDLLEWEEEYERELSDEEADAWIESGEAMLNADAIREFLVAVSTGLTVVEDMTPEEAQDRLNDWDNRLEEFRRSKEKGNDE